MSDGARTSRKGAVEGDRRWVGTQLIFPNTPGPAARHTRDILAGCAPRHRYGYPVRNAVLALNHCRDRRSAEPAITEGDAPPAEVVAVGFVGVKDLRSGRQDEPADRGIGDGESRDGTTCRSDRRLVSIADDSDGGARAGGAHGRRPDLRVEPVSVGPGADRTQPTTASASTTITTTRANTITPWPPRPGPRAPACATTGPGC